jgi:AcrR family transcriptional regulator
LEVAVSTAKRQNRMPRWKRRPEVRPQQILEAAFRVFGTRGLHQATLDDVARAAGITKGTIYLYFPSKAALFSAMLRARVSDLLPPMKASDGRSTASLHHQLEMLAQRLYQFFKSFAYLAMYRTMVGEASQFPETATLLYREGILPTNRQLTELFRRGIASKEFRALDPLIAARALVGMLQVFVVSQRLLGGQRIFPIADAKIVRTVTEIFFRGLLASSRPTGRVATRGAR